MIIAEPKPIDEIIDSLKDFNRILVAGCDGCVTVCEAGGMKEVEVVASALRIYFKQAGRAVTVDEISLTRQCDRPYTAQLADKIDQYDAVLSLACGVGVQFLAEDYKNKPIFPGVNTCFMGGTEEKGLWTERCQGCGKCILANTGGICPIARCSKRMLNGPCGGSSDGRCEVNKDIACGWHLIYERLKELGQLDRFETPTDPKDWNTSRDGGPRKVIKEVSRL
ncbi:methylenetetrahydrofolate reductase C-terminal domain-containing protein [Desulforhabdus sp. TSK]|uniref:methylenetetrahydrofolate reductase C-terminal domain-containing protein n=1 Tax=Desulforhabdus sp. TSK TaxID=2925014 RepID=UPI001FC81BED|nr:methylenetetrahydrofolate reductase C-terminal domain-containing protein [Desulforhabdus sp. TSK]GKT08559.1 zinc-finger protein [Desulforhabdus sp. TSK]